MTIKVIALESLSIPMPNTKKVKDVAGNIPERIAVNFQPGDEFEISEEEFKQYTTPTPHFPGFKIKKVEKSSAPVNP